MLSICFSAWRLFVGSRRVLRAEAVADDRDELQEDLHRLSDLWREEQERQERMRQDLDFKLEEERARAAAAIAASAALPPMLPAPPPNLSQLVVIPTKLPLPSATSDDNGNSNESRQIIPHVHTLMAHPPPAPPPPPRPPAPPPVPPPAPAPLPSKPAAKRSISAGGAPLSSASTAASAAREAANKHRALVAHQQQQRRRSMAANLEPQPPDVASALHNLTEQIIAVRASLSPPRRQVEQHDPEAGVRELQLAIEVAGWQPLGSEKGSDPIITSPGPPQAGGDSARISFVPHQSAQWVRMAASAGVEDEPEPIARSLPPPPPSAPPPGIIKPRIPPPLPRVASLMLHPPRIRQPPKHEAANKRTNIDTVSALAKRKDLNLPSNLLALPKVSKDDIDTQFTALLDPQNKPRVVEAPSRPPFVPPPALSHAPDAAMKAVVCFSRQGETCLSEQGEEQGAKRTYIRLPGPARFSIQDMR